MESIEVTDKLFSKIETDGDNFYYYVKGLFFKTVYGWEEVDCLVLTPIKGVPPIASLILKNGCTPWDVSIVVLENSSQETLALLIRVASQFELEMENPIKEDMSFDLN